MGDFIELIFGLVSLGFILFMIIGMPMAYLADSKKPKPRKRRRAYNLDYRTFNITPRDFDYYHRSQPGEFFVYFISNEKLGVLKIGVGNGGRIRQLLESFTDKDAQFPNIGWEILKVAQFSDSPADFESGKIAANEAERRAHFYWRYVLGFPLYLSEEQMGYSRIKKTGETIWTRTPGYTETVAMERVCEVSTWNYVIKSPGFIREVDSFSKSSSRPLRLLETSHSELDIPIGYENFKLVNINHVNPKALENTKKTNNQERRLRESEQSVKVLKRNSTLPESVLSYPDAGIGVYPCSTTSCPWPSQSMFESQACEKCSEK